jgi:hypothetical protein
VNGQEDLTPESPAAKLARSRAELQTLFEPEENAPGAATGSAQEHGAFPRSRTMKLLTKGAGPAGLAVMALALFATSPAKARMLLRYLPMGAITKIVVARFINSRGDRK